MSIIQDGRVGSVAATVDPTFDALRVSMRPPELEGAYRLCMTSGNIAATTGAGNQFSFRYAGTGACVINSIRMGLQTTTAYTQNAMSHVLYVVRGFTVSDLTGAVAGGSYTTGSGLSQKLRQTMPAHQIVAYICSTGLLTGGTGTNDPQPIAACHWNQPDIITAQGFQDLYSNQSPYSTQLTLTQNEGFRIVTSSAYGATGISVLTVAVEWMEYPAISAAFF